MNVIDDIKALTSKKKEPEGTAPSRAPKKILIVEDEQSLADVLVARLTDEGFSVKRAENGQKGLELAVSFQPDIILLDLLMPVMDGKELLRVLRKTPECNTIPVVILSNAGSIENIRDTQFYSDADEFLIKSNVSMEEIVTKIKEKLLATRISS